MFIKNGVEEWEVPEKPLKQERKMKENEGFLWLPWRTTLEDEDLKVERCSWLENFVGLERVRESLSVVKSGVWEREWRGSWSVREE